MERIFLYSDQKTLRIWTLFKKYGNYRIVLNLKNKYIESKHLKIKSLLNFLHMVKQAALSDEDEKNEKKDTFFPRKVKKENL